MKKDSVLVAVKGNASIEKADAVLEEFKTALSQKKSIQINVSDVKKCDASFFQLLLSLGRSAKAENLQCTIKNFSENKYFLSAMQDLGFSYTRELQNLFHLEEMKKEIPDEQ